MINAYATITEQTLNEVGEALVLFRNWLDDTAPFSSISDTIDTAIESYLAHVQLIQKQDNEEQTPQDVHTTVVYFPIKDA